MALTTAASDIRAGGVSGRWLDAAMLAAAARGVGQHVERHRTDDGPH